MRLPVILLGELLAGMALGVVWPALTAGPPPVPQTAMTAVTVPVPVALTVPVPAAVPVVTHAPRNPFGTPHGIDASQQRTVVPPPAQPVAPAGPVRPSDPGVVGVPVHPPIYPPPAQAPAAPALVPAPPAGGPALNPADLVYN